MALALLVLAVLGGPAPAAEISPWEPVEDEGWQALLDSIAERNWGLGLADGDPLCQPMEICLGTACAEISAITLTSDEAEQVRGLFATDQAATAAGERAALAAAIARIEAMVGPRNGSWADRPRNAHDEDEPGQLDCISETANTRTYLDRLTQAGLLRRHRVDGIAVRYLLLLQHVAVRLLDVESRELFIVDSWEGANGAEPLVEPFSNWRWRLYARPLAASGVAA